MSDAPPVAEPAPAVPTRIDLAISVGPLGNVVGNIATVLGDALLPLLAMFYPPPLCKKANVVMTELVQNVMENLVDRSADVRVQLAIDGAALVVAVTNKVTPEQRAAVEARIGTLAALEDPKKLFAETLRARRVQRLRGGLGLMRLVSENKFRLSTHCEHDHLTVRAEFPLRGG